MPDEATAGLIRRTERLLCRARLAKAARPSANRLATPVAQVRSWWHAASEPKWKHIRQHLAGLPERVQRDLVEAFVDCARPRSLSLEDPDVAAPLVEALLEVTRLDAAVRLVIRVCGMRIDRRVRGWIELGAVTEIGAYRRGEPRIRLLICHTGAPGGRGRGHSMHGLYAMLAAMGAKLEFIDEGARS